MCAIGPAGGWQAEFRRGGDETSMDSDRALGAGHDAGGSDAASELEQGNQRELTRVYARRKPEVPTAVQGVGVPDVGRGYELQPEHEHGSLHV